MDRVEDYCTSRADVEKTMQKFQEMISKYQYMELNQQKRAASLKEKMPDIQKTLDTVRFLKTRKVRLWVVPRIELRIIRLTRKYRLVRIR